MKFPDLIKVRGYNPNIEADLSEMVRAVELLLNAERPIIMAGGGVILSGAFSELQALAELAKVPVAGPRSRAVYSWRTTRLPWDR